jgi:putative oxidoreductase
MNIILWVLQILLALLFMLAGVSKFLTPADEMAKDMPSFLSINFIYFIGVCEILGSIGLVVPWLTKIKPMAIIPATTSVLSAIVAWGRKGSRSV